MAEIKKRLGSLSHKPDCQCRFCQTRRGKEPTQPTQPVGTIPMTDEPLKHEPVIESAEAPTANPVAEKLVESVTGDNKDTHKPEPPKKDEKVSVLKERFRYSWKKLTLGIAVAVLGIVLVIYGNMLRNVAMIAPGALAVVGGAWLIVQGREQAQVRTIKGKIKLRDANCLVIANKNVGFIKEETDNLLGMPKQCINDGKFYHIHFKGLDGNGSISEFLLPDPDPNERYYDPNEAINCLRMELTKKYFNYQPSSGGVVSMIVMGVIIAIEVIALIAMGG